MTTWLVYRDGWRWSVQANHLVDALRRACLRTDSMSGQQYVDLGSKREPAEAPAVGDHQPIALRDRGDHSIEAVHVRNDLGENIVQIIDVTGKLSHAEACAVLERACAVLERARELLTGMRGGTESVLVRGSDGRPVAVQCYKTGAKALSVRALLSRYQAGKLERDGSIAWNDTPHRKRLLDELERDGLIKWPAKTTADEKTRVLDGIVRNAALVDVVESFAWLVELTEQVCDSLVPPPKPLSALTEAELRERREQTVAELAALHPNATARHEINERIAAIDRRLEPIDSVREYGLDVGTVVDVSPAPWDDEQVVRRACVVRVEVDHRKSYGLPVTEHRRVVEYEDGSESNRPTVDRLRAVADGTPDR
jgi:hypothetical protein